MNYFNAWNKSRVAKRLEVQIGSSQFACHMQSQALTTQNDQGRSRLRRTTRKTRFSESP